MLSCLVGMMAMNKFSDLSSDNSVGAELLYKARRGFEKMLCPRTTASLAVKQWSREILKCHRNPVEFTTSKPSQRKTRKFL
jgi:hypothetical protein